MHRPLLVLAVALSFATGTALAADADPGFPVYGNLVIVPDSFPGIVGVNTDIDVRAFNYGTQASSSFEVELSYNDWGVTYQGWQSLGTLPYSAATGIPAPGNEMKTFSHVFANRAHTCLQAQILNAADNMDTSNDRTQINWEVVHADEDYHMWVPFGNAANEDIVVNGTTISCFKDGIPVACFPGWEGGVDADGQPCRECPAPEPELRDAPGMHGDSVLRANQEQVALVTMPAIPAEGMVVLVQAMMDGELNHVMINVVKTTVSELLNTAHFCCIKSVRTRVLLESMLADALEAFEAGDCKRALKLLRMFVQKAILLECDLTDAEIACIEKAILKIVDAGIMIARGKPEKHSQVVVPSPCPTPMPAIGLLEETTFTGADSDAITFPGSLAISAGQSFAFAGWVRFNRILPFARIFDFGTIALYVTIMPGMRFTTHSENHLVVDDFFQEGVDWDSAPDALAQTTSWFHIAVTIDGAGNRAMYKNGALVGSDVSAPLAAGELAPLYLGKSDWFDSDIWYSRMTTREFKFFEAALTHDCVANLFEGNPSPPLSPEAQPGASVPSVHIQGAHELRRAGLYEAALLEASRAC
mmetsp:Transcript_5809/g.13923  ORF Transcript_5809/g.13923 Transcript_5809/m.13923 type:complete len:587 (+) Transcript_5809:128-1888(+)